MGATPTETSSARATRENFDGAHAAKQFDATARAIADDLGGEERLSAIQKHILRTLGACVLPWQRWLRIGFGSHLVGKAQPPLRVILRPPDGSKLIPSCVDWELTPIQFSILKIIPRAALFSDAPSKNLEVEISKVVHCWARPTQLHRIKVIKGRNAVPATWSKRRSSRLAQPSPCLTLARAGATLLTYSMTSSARARKVGGTSRPSARAVRTFRTRSSLVDCTTGRSAGFSPLRMRPT